MPNPKELPTFDPRGSPKKEVETTAALTKVLLQLATPDEKVALPPMRPKRRKRCFNLTVIESRERNAGAAVDEGRIKTLVHGSKDQVSHWSYDGWAGLRMVGL